MPAEDSFFNKMFLASNNSVNKVSSDNKKVSSNSSNGAKEPEFVFDLDDEPIGDSISIGKNNKSVNQANNYAASSAKFNAGGSYGKTNSSYNSNFFNPNLSSLGFMAGQGAIQGVGAALDALDYVSVGEIEQAIQDKTAELDEAQNSLSQVNNGTHPDISALKEVEDAAFEAYQDKIAEKSKEDGEALSKAKQDVDSAKQALDEMDANIKQKEGEIASAEARIQDCNSKISSLEGSITSLEFAISSAGEDEDTSGLEAKLAAAKNQLAAAKAEKQEAEEQKTKLTYEKGRMVRQKGNNLEPKYDEACKALAEIEKKYENDADIQPLKEAYEQAKEALEAKKTELTSTIQKDIDTKRGELDELNTKLTEAQNTNSKKKYSPNQEFDFDFEEKMSSEQEYAMDLFKEKYAENKDKYLEVAKATGMPPELIAAIHWREAGGNFEKYLHNGDPLGKPTTHVPKGIYFEDWTSAAIDAISSEMPKMEKSEFADGSLEYYLDFAERYNGLGYRDMGKPSPYVWAGTDNYSGGKYVEDGRYDPNHIDQQLGVALMLKALMA